MYDQFFPISTNNTTVIISLQNNFPLQSPMLILQLHFIKITSLHFLQHLKYMINTNIIQSLHILC